MKEYVYHGSTIQGLKELIPKPSAIGVPYVYATTDDRIALFFIGRPKIESPRSLYIGYNFNEDNVMEIYERVPNVFEEFYNIDASLYYLSSENFSNKTGRDIEVVSEFSEKVVREERFNVLKKLKEYEKLGKIKLYTYPNRPRHIPLDNSDLINVAASRYKDSEVNLKMFFELYPNLKEKYFEKLNK